MEDFSISSTDAGFHPFLYFFGHFQLGLMDEIDIFFPINVIMFL